MEQDLKNFRKNFNIKKMVMTSEVRVQEKVTVEVSKIRDDLLTHVEGHKNVLFLVDCINTFKKLNDKYFGTDECKNKKFDDKFSWLLNEDSKFATKFKDSLKTPNITLDDAVKKVCEVYKYCEEFQESVSKLEKLTNEHIITKTQKNKISCEHKDVMSSLRLFIIGM